MVVAKFAFLQVQHELIRSAAVELRKPPLGKAPEILYPVDMAFSAHELVMRMEHPVVVVPVHYKPIIALPAVSVNHRVIQYFAL